MTDRDLTTVFVAFLTALAALLLCATVYVEGGYQQRDRDALALVDDGCEHREHYRPCATCGTYDENGAMVAPPME
jgi:hypothetical protein